MTNCRKCIFFLPDSRLCIKYGICITDPSKPPEICTKSQISQEIIVYDKTDVLKERLKEIAERCHLKVLMCDMNETSIALLLSDKGDIDEFTRRVNVICNRDPIRIRREKSVYYVEYPLRLEKATKAPTGFEDLFNIIDFLMTPFILEKISSEEVGILERIIFEQDSKIFKDMKIIERKYIKRAYFGDFKIYEKEDVEFYGIDQSKTKFYIISPKFYPLVFCYKRGRLDILDTLLEKHFGEPTVSYCPNCGVKLKGFENYCPYCGYKLKEPKG